MPLASARQHPENQKENQAGHSPERTVGGFSEGLVAVGMLSARECACAATGRTFGPGVNCFFIPATGLWLIWPEETKMMMMMMMMMMVN